MSDWLVLAQGTVPAAQHVTQDPTIIAGAIAAAIVLVLSSLGGTVVLIVNAISASKDRREAAAARLLQLQLAQSTNKYADETAKKADTLISDTREIHAMTNSTNSKLQSALDLKNEELAGIRALVAKMAEEKRETAAMRVVTDLQTSTALATPVIPVAVVPLVAGVRGSRASDTAPLEPAANGTLKKIEENTAATADAVKDLKP